jgi:GNAT superfamily N-acetyltransferase
MSIIFRNYTSEPGITPDYRAAREMLLTVGYREFTYARWDWATTHGHLKTGEISRMGLWEESGRVVGAALFDCVPGDSFLMCLPGYEHLRREMLIYARGNMRGEGGNFRVVIPETDKEYQALAASEGLTSTPDAEHDAALFVGQTKLDYALPAGYRITDMREMYDMYQYGRVLWKGFNHEKNGECAYADALRVPWCGVDGEMKRENVDLSIKIAAVAPDGNFCAYCGMWYEPRAGFAVVEPVATDPDHRMKGLGRAVVLEGIRRTAEMGARLVVVGSSQQFYYSIGMRPYATNTLWKG